MDNYDNIYENEEELIELEKEVLSAESNELVENETFETTLSNSLSNKKGIQESNLIDSKKSTCIFPPKEPIVGGHLSYEIIGFGTNKKVY